MGDAVAAPAFGVALEEFADLEEEHHEHCLGKLCLRAGQEAYAEGSEGGYGHQEMLVEHVAAGYPLGGFPECASADEQVGHEVDEQQLPGREAAVVLDDHRCGEKYRSDGYKGHPALHAAVCVVVGGAGCMIMAGVGVSVSFHGSVVFCLLPEIVLPAASGFQLSVAFNLLRQN